MSRMRATTKKKSTKSTRQKSEEKAVRPTSLTRADFRALASICHTHGHGELVRGVAALLEVDQDIAVVDSVHHLSERLHAVGDDLLKLHQLEAATGKFYYGSA